MLVCHQGVAAPPATGGRGAGRTATPDAIRGGAPSLGWLAALLVGAAGPAEGQHYDFELTRVELSGASSFVDEFSDGERDLPPTSAFDDLFGTTTEEPGFLRLASFDGAESFAHPEASLWEPATGRRDAAVLSGAGLAFVDGAGSGVFRSTWTGALPEVSGLDYDRQLSSLLLLSGSGGSGSLTLSVLASDYTGQLANATCQHGGPSVSMLYLQAFLVVFACDSFDPAEVTGPVVLELGFDDATDTLSFAYSLDGGASFRASSGWEVPRATLDVSSEIQNGYAVLGVGASATRRPSVLPGPGLAVAAALLASGGLALAGRRGGL